MHSRILALATSCGVAMIASVATAAPAVTHGGGPLLAGPGADYATLDKLQPGARVNVVWCGTHQNWCLVSEHGRMGWVPLADLSRTVNGAAVAAGESNIGTNGSTAGSPTAQPEARAALGSSSSGGATAASAGSSASGKVGSGL